MTRLRKSLTVLFLLALALPAQAETYTVVNSDSSGSGSLYWAVNSVNANNTAGHTISFDARIKHITIPQELTLNKSVTIKGGGATLERSGSGRLFTITDGRAEFECLTFTKGYAVSDNGGAGLRSFRRLHKLHFLQQPRRQLRRSSLHNKRQSYPAHNPHPLHNLRQPRSKRRRLRCPQRPRRDRRHNHHWKYRKL